MQFYLVKRALPLLLSLFFCLSLSAEDYIGNILTETTTEACTSVEYLACIQDNAEACTTEFTAALDVCRDSVIRPEFDSLNSEAAVLYVNDIIVCAVKEQFETAILRTGNDELCEE